MPRQNYFLQTSNRGNPGVHSGLLCVSGRVPEGAKVVCKLDPQKPPRREHPPSRDCAASRCTHGTARRREGRSPTSRRTLHLPAQTVVSLPASSTGLGLASPTWPGVMGGRPPAGGSALPEAQGSAPPTRGEPREPPAGHTAGMVPFAKTTS